MKTSIILYCLLLTTVSFGQKWTRIDSSVISYIDPATFSDTNQRDNNFSCYYFEKDSVLIGIPTRFASHFINLFKQAPNAFDSLVKYSFWSFIKSQVHSRAYDTALFLLDFKKGIVFYDITIRNTKEGMTWTLENKRFDKDNRCYNEVYFKKVKYGKSEKFVFKSVSDHTCEI